MTIGEFKQLLLEQGVPDDAEMVYGFDSEKATEIDYLILSNTLEIL